MNFRVISVILLSCLKSLVFKLLCSLFLTLPVTSVTFGGQSLVRITFVSLEFLATVFFSFLRPEKDHLCRNHRCVKGRLLKVPVVVELELSKMNSCLFPPPLLEEASRTCVSVQSSSPSGVSRGTSNSCRAFFTSHCASLAKWTYNFWTNRLDKNLKSSVNQPAKAFQVLKFLSVGLTSEQG